MADYKRLPIPLTASTKRPSFPLETLPEWLSTYAANVGAVVGMEPDMAAMFGLTVLGVGAGRRVVVSPRAGHREPANLYTLGVMGSGEGKSFVVEHMTAPVYTLEAELQHNSAEERRATAVRRELADAQAVEARKAAARAVGAERAGAIEEAIAAQTAADAITVPAKPRLVADDATAETLTSLIAAQGGKLAILSAEGGIFDSMQGRYSNVPNLDVYLKAHTGDELRVDRRDREERISRPALTVGLAVQPNVLATIGQQAAFVGRGLMARFLTYVPESHVSRRNWLTLPELDAAAEAEYQRHMTAILRSLLVTNPFCDAEELIELRLEPDATAEWLGFRNRVERELADDGVLSALRDWGNKLAGQVLRLAGLLHIAHSDARRLSETVTVETVRAAIAIGEFLIPHAVAAYEALAPSETTQLAARVLKAIKSAFEVGQPFSRKQLLDKMRSSTVSKSEDLIAPLTLLCNFEWLKEVPPEDDRTHRAGRKPSPRYMAHPVLWDDSDLKPPAVVEAA